MESIEEPVASVAAGAAGTAGAVVSLPLPAAAQETLGLMIDGLSGTDRHIAWTMACRAEQIDQARRWSEITSSTTAPMDSRWDADTIARRALVSELACPLRIPERTAETLIGESKALVHELHQTMAALKEGDISYRHASVLIGHASSLPAQTRPGFEAAVLPHARKLTVSKFDRKARAVRERTHPDSITARHREAIAERCLQFQPAADGMAYLTLHGPAPAALAIFTHASDTAASLQGPDEPRTLTQLRADAFIDAALTGLTGPDALNGLTSQGDGTADATPPGRRDRRGRRDRGRSPRRRRVEPGIRARVFVTVPVLTLLDKSEEPGTLEGYGPIDADTARQLAGHAPSFTRILTHPETGTVLSVGRTRYTVPNDLRTWLRIRDETCRFPGCNRNAARCDIDHSHDWQCGGTTSGQNLAHLCPAHHQLKHNTTWAVTHARDGTLDWTSPTRHEYFTEPATTLPVDPPF